jgi:hypothetical protein
MDAVRQTDDKQPTKGGPLPGLLRPPIVFLSAILLGIALNRAWSLPFTHFSSAVLNFQFARETTEQGNLSPCGQLLQTCLHF